LGPAVLLAGVLPVALKAMDNAVRTAQTNQIDRALESDALSARILARGLDQELRQREAELLDVTQDQNLRQAIQEAEASGWKNRKKLWSVLDQWWKRAKQRCRERGVREDASWFLCDSKGFQRWRSVISPITIDRNWSHRDYFHGRNVNYQPGHVPPDIGPIRRPHISVAYRGTSEQKYKVAISVPVFGSDGKTVIAVLARSSELGDLLADYELKIHQSGRSPIRRVITLIDKRDGNLLYHPWIRAAHQRKIPDDVRLFAQLRVDRQVVEELARLQPQTDSGVLATFRTACYYDPVGKILPQQFGGRWLAAFCPVCSTSWAAGVQEPFTEAVQPVRRLEQDLRRYFWTAVGVFFVLLGGVWLVAARLFWEEEPPNTSLWKGTPSGRLTS